MKIYSLETLGKEHSLPIPLKAGANRYIKFVKEVRTDATAFFSTSDVALQNAIESSQFFESSTEPEIKLFFSADDDEVVAKPPTQKKVAVPAVNKPTFDPAEFADVTTFEQAKAILSAEPYNVAKISPSLRTPPAIFKKAAEFGITFPNLKAE